MHNIPTGPIGAEDIIPINKPLKMKSSISICIGNCIPVILGAKLQKLYEINKFS